MIISMDLPSASSALQPNIVCAPAFHKRTMPSRSPTTMAVGLWSTMLSQSDWWVGSSFIEILENKSRYSFTPILEEPNKEIYGRGRGSGPKALLRDLCASVVKRVWNCQFAYIAIARSIARRHMAQNDL